MDARRFVQAACQPGERAATLGAFRLLVGFSLICACEGSLIKSPELKLLVRGEAQLSAYGWDACSTGGPAAAGRGQWCAFYRRSDLAPDRTELWVINVSRVMNGESVECDGSGSACLRMTDRLFTGLRIESPSHPEAHRFEGDTLFFLAEANASTADLNRYEGFVWAWRPGWQKPRRLTTDRGVLCQGTDRAPVAFCVDSVIDTPLTFDLRAGVLVDSDDSLLPVVERIAPLIDGELAWSSAFAPAGDVLAFSSLRPGEDLEALRTVRFADAGRSSPQDIVKDGRAWMLSEDGRAVYFIRAGSRQAGIGDLWAAEFPGGGSARMLSRGVGRVEVLAGGAVAFITDMQGLEGRLHILPDWRQPALAAVVVEDAHAFYPVDDGRFLYILQVNDEGERGLIADVARGAVCELRSRPGVTAYSPGFFPQLGLLSWTEPDASDEDVKVTFLGRPRGCEVVRPVGIGLEYLEAAGSRGFIYGAKDDLNLLTLSYVGALGSGPLTAAAGVPFLSGVAADNIGSVGGLPDAIVVGTHEQAPMGKGLFVFGPFESAARPARH